MFVQFDPKRTLVIIDGSSFLYRAYYSLRPLHTRAGAPVHAVYSFCRMLKKLIGTLAPEQAVLVWDSKGKTIRHEVYPAYKATRQAPPSDLFAQKETIMKFADLIHLAQVMVPGVEADDLMYTLACLWKKQGGSVVLVTSDKDMAQLLDEHTVLYDAFKEQTTDVAAFEQKMGFSVTKLPFYFALVGDASDNIPGVRGVGEKSATQLVQQYASLTDLYAQLATVEPKRVRVALEHNKENAFLSEKLFLLQENTLDISLETLRFNSAYWDKAIPLFQELEFKSLIPAMHGLPQLQGLSYTFTAVTTSAELTQLAQAMEKAGAYALDTETTGEHPLQATCVGISVCVCVGQAYYLPFGHKTGELQLTPEEVVTVLKPLLENRQHKKYLHNAKFDALVLSMLGIELQGVVFDTMLAADLVTNDEQRVGLKWLSEHFFNERMLSFDEVVKQHKFTDFSYVPVLQATAYAAADAHQTLKLVEYLHTILQQEPLLNKLFEMLELPLMHVLYHMEKRGIHLNVAQLYQLGSEVAGRLDAIEQEILTLLGQKYQDINLNSPKQIERLLFYDLGLPPQKKSAKGTSYSTDYEVLKALAHIHIIPALILQYRELFKLKSTYIDALPTYVNARTGNIHTSFSQVAVATGRLASSSPNLQNIPADGTGYGLKVREAFVPEPGYLFISADYSQIELRVLAHLSQDEHLKDAFLHNRDIHAQTAARLFQVPLDAVTHEQRQIGKRVNFSVLYGLTPYGLSKDIGISLKEAKQYIDTYFAQYPGVLAWMNNTVAQAQTTGYVTTLGGRRRFVQGINEKNKHLFDAARRIAINTPAQGTAAEVMKQGMLALQKLFIEKKYDAHMLLQIHDELLIMVRAHHVDELGLAVQQSLETVVVWEVPLKVTVRQGDNWAQVTK